MSMLIKGQGDWGQCVIPLAFFVAMAHFWLMFSFIHQDPQVIFYKAAFQLGSP